MTLTKALIKNFPRTKFTVQADSFWFRLEIIQVQKRNGTIFIRGNITDLTFGHGIALRIGELVQVNVQRTLEADWPYLKTVDYRVMLSQLTRGEMVDWEVGHVGEDRLEAVLAIIDFCTDQGFAKKDIVKLLGEAQALVRDAL